MPSDPRARLLDAIAPAIPPGWDKKRYTVRAVGTLARSAIFIDYTTISHEGMPPGQVFDTYEVAIVSSLTDYEKAEQQIDPVARALITLLDASTTYSWSTAEKRAAGDYLAWIIPVQQISHTTPKE